MRSSISLLHAMLLRPLPFPDGDRLVAVVDQIPDRCGADDPADRSGNPRRSHRGHAARGHLVLRPAGCADSWRDRASPRIRGRVEAAFLGTIGVQPALGRLFTPDDHIPGRDRVVIVTDGFWRSNLGGDPAVIDQRIVVNGAPSTIVGVLPASFSFDYLSAGPDRAVRAISDGCGLHVPGRRVCQRAPRHGDRASEAGRHAGPGRGGDAGAVGSSPRGPPAALPARIGWTGSRVLDERDAAPARSSAAAAGPSCCCCSARSVWFF